MANRYDIVHIDFQASARGANAAIESLRQEAEKSNGKLQEMRDTLDSMKKSGASDEAIASGGEGTWWEYIATTDMVKFLKKNGMLSPKKQKIL